jgi:predicted metalloprotease
MNPRNFESSRAQGTEAQRTDAFFTGYESGRRGQCNF